MKRQVEETMAIWKDSKYRKPLILRGARQVGKTWLMKYFGLKYYETTAYVDFQSNNRMQALFQGDFDIPRLIEGLQVECRTKIQPGSTLLIFDEIQEVPLALTSLKYFQENAPQYHIVAGGSLLGVGLHAGTSFPVGKVDFCNLYPMSFLEFLDGIGEAELAELLRSCDWRLIAAFKSRFIDYLRKYYFVGGMPECVSTYAQSREYDSVRRVQNAIMVAYDLDFSKHVPGNMVDKLRSVWNKIPGQLAREHKRFSPGIIKKGSRLHEYESSIQWLKDAGLIYMVECITKPGLPLKNYTDVAFKLYIHDVGLLGCLADLDVKTLLEENRIFEEFKGSLTEQFVCQELMQRGIIPFYWASGNTAEVDFVMKWESNVLPIEVKAEENLQGKSLRLYSAKYNPPVALRTTLRDYHEDGWVTNIPLYGIGVWK